MPNIGERIKRSWNAFMGRDPTPKISYGIRSGYRPDRVRFRIGSSRSILNAIYNRIAVDCSQIDVRHVKLDENNEKYVETVNSTLNECFRLNANLDQTGRAFIQDVVMSMFDEGCVAIVPTDTIGDFRQTDSYKITKLRSARVKEWYPSMVTVEAYNELTGRKELLTLPKYFVAIVENPFYSIMNEPNSVLQRLVQVLNHIDRTNEQNSSGKLDLIIQFPYAIKSDAMRERAERRRKDMEAQLTFSQYGIAYADATERITQLNRPVENNLWQQATDLTNQLYNELGLTEAIFNGTADEKTMLNYYNRTIEPIMAAIVNEMERKWLSKTARSQHQAIRFFRDPFRLVPIGDLAEMGDKFTRNEILSSNEFRAIIGYRPSDEPKANQLINSNLNHSPDEIQQEPSAGEDDSQQPVDDENV